ncbi:uncharacterized protein LOC135461342 isoform X2 [Liolophura sinensis]|uniref:uncharacterized protein LOC135461342 isoform X2 n=1 Tax=Liolophura sinensis TaxID=3198878 RepID=UPI0031580F3E
MGKTALAEEVCHRSKLETILINNLRRKKSMRDFFLSIFYSLCRSKMIRLSNAQKINEEVKFTENFGQTLDTLIDRVEETLLSYKTDTVLLLDNVDEIEQHTGEEFLTALQTFLNIKTDKVKFVMTNRRELSLPANPHPETLLQIELKALPRDEAKQLLKNSMKETQHVRLKDLQSNFLVQKCQCCPLVIKTVMKNMQSYSDEDFRPCLEAVFDSLSKGQQKRLMELSFFETVFNEEMAKSVIMEEQPCFGLSKLAKENLLQKHEIPGEAEKNITYSFHPLVLDCLAKVCAKYPDRNYTDLKDKARLHFFEFFSGKIRSLKLESNYYYRGNDYAYIIDFKPYFDQFFQVLQENGYQFPKNNEKKSAALETLCKVLRFSSDREEQKIFLRDLDLSLENKDTEADAVEEFNVKVRRVILLRELQDNEAVNILMKLDEKSSQIDQLPNKDFPLKNFALGRYFYAKGLITMDQTEQCHNQDEREKRHDFALGCFSKSLKQLEHVESKSRLKSLKETIEVEMAKVHNAKGSIHYRMQDYEKSFFEFEQAYSCLCKYLKKNHMINDGHINVPFYFYNMGNAKLKMAAEFRRRNEKGRAECSLEDALQYMQKALDITKKLGTSDNKTTVLWLLNIADVERQLAGYTEALENYRKASNHGKHAWRILKKPRVPRELLVNTLHTLGFIQYAKGRHLQRPEDSSLTDDARQAFEKSARYYRLLSLAIVDGKLCRRINRRIRQIHLKVVEILEDKDWEKTQRFYQDFHEGKLVWGDETSPQERLSEDYYLVSSDEEEEDPSETATRPKKQDSGFEDVEVAPPPSVTRRSVLVKQVSFDERTEGPLGEPQTTLSTTQQEKPPLGNLLTEADASSMPQKRARFQKQSSFNVENEELSVTEDGKHQTEEEHSIDNGDVELPSFNEANPRKRLDSAQHDSTLGDSISESFDRTPSLC